MKDVISYSLFGNKSMYLNGAIANARLAKSIYPGWICHFYIDDTVPEVTVNSLRSEGAEIIVKSKSTDMFGMIWRFEPAFNSNVRYFVVRDIDDRLTYREKAAVDEWIASGKSFHVMRDHPNHKHSIMGGMWGGISGSIPEFKQLLDQYASMHNPGFWWDMQFLGECLWGRYIKNDHIAHDEYWRPIGSEKKFSMPLENINVFIGNKYEADGKSVYDLIKNNSDNSGRFLCHNLGLGDHLICNGLIRAKAEEAGGKNIYIFAKRHNVQSVMFMFRDLPNVHVIGVGSDADVQTIIAPYSDSNKILTGVYREDFRSIPNKSFDEIFYIQIGISFDARWDKFHIQRDDEEENRIFEQLYPKKPYVFVHDDPERGYGITKNIPSNYSIVRPIKELTNLFGYLKLIENAEEVHLIDSSFMFLIDSLPNVGKNLYIHRYVRISELVSCPMLFPSLRRAWTIIK